MSLCINPQCQQPQNSDNVLFCQACGSELLLNGRYRVARLVGSGGFGKTYEISDRITVNTQHRVDSIKVLKVLINNHSKAVELFQREAEVLSYLQHPGIPKVEADGYFIYFPRNYQIPLYCLVMEKIEGLNLHEYLRQRGNRPIEEKLALQWLVELTGILKQVHSQNFFHRDIKPTNIMLRADGGLALIDFGTVRQVTGTYLNKQAVGQVTGIVSAGYTPPEQINGQAVQQSDFFALARTFVYLLTAQDPLNFYDAGTDELKWRIKTSNVSSQFADFLDEMMARIPSQRPANADKILQHLEKFNQISPSKKFKTFNTSLQASQSTVIESSQNSYNRSFFYQWMLGSCVGVSIGIFMHSIATTIVYSLVARNVGFRYAILSAVITVLPVEIIQWLVLRRRVNWDFLSMLETGLAVLVGLLLGASIGRILFGGLGQLIGSLIGIFMGTTFGKWLVLQRQFKQAYWWLLIAVVGIPISVSSGLAVGMIVNLFLSRIWLSSTSLAVSFAIGVTVGVIFLTLITGLALVWLLKRPIRISK